MTWTQCRTLVCASLLATSSGLAVAAKTEAPQAAATPASRAAAASPELVGALSKEIGATPDQAAGAAGALFHVAQSRLKAPDFSQVASAVPGMTSLLKAAPSAGGSSGGAASALPSGASSALSQMAGSAGGLASAMSAFTKLGLKPELVAKAIPVLTTFVTKSGGAGVGNLLAGVLK